MIKLMGIAFDDLPPIGDKSSVFSAPISAYDNTYALWQYLINDNEEIFSRISEVKIVYNDGKLSRFILSVNGSKLIQTLELAELEFPNTLYLSTTGAGLSYLKDGDYISGPKPYSMNALLQQTELEKLTTLIGFVNTWRFYDVANPISTDLAQQLWQECYDKNQENATAILSIILKSRLAEQLSGINPRDIFSVMNNEQTEAFKLALMLYKENDVTLFVKNMVANIFTASLIRNYSSLTTNTLVNCNG